MCDNIEVGKIIKKTVRDKNQKIVAKAFYIQNILAEGDDWKVLGVIDQQTMRKTTLKIIAKTQTLPKQRKEQIFNQIQNQKKMSGRLSFIDLQDVFEDSNSSYLLMEKEVQLLFCQLVDILEQLRANNITHGNINLQSLLLCQKSINHLQLTNFSNSQDISKAQTFTSTASNKFFHSEKQDINTEKRTQNKKQDTETCRIKYGNMQINEYTSPQQLFCQDREFSKRMLVDRDIWSCGVLLFKLLTGTYPFSNEAGKLAPNRIKNATFSFPKLDAFLKKFDHFDDIVFKNRFSNDYLSLQWKELLKKMLSVKQQRITIQQLINHPFRQEFMELKLIPNIKNSLPSLTNLYSSQTSSSSIKIQKKSNIFQKAWQANFEEQSQSQIEEEEQLLSSHCIKNSSVYKRYPVKVNLSKVPMRQSRENSIVEGSKQPNPIRISKALRNHKTQFPTMLQQPPLLFIRDTPLNTFKQPNRQEEQELITIPSTFKTVDPSDERDLLLAKQPIFLVKFKYFKKEKSLGYILNNSVGVVFPDKNYIIGLSKQNYRYIESISNSEKETPFANKDNRSLKQSRKVRPQLSGYLGKYTPNQPIMSKQNLKLPRKPLKLHRNEQQFKSKVQPKCKYTDSDLIPQSLLANRQLRKISKAEGFTSQNGLQQGKQLAFLQKLNIYHKVIDFFGQRAVSTDLDLWVQQFWRDGNTYTFLLSNGCWQVAFLQRKGFRIYAVDQKQFSWSQNKVDSPDFSYVVRSIIKRYESEVKKTKRSKKDK